MIPVRERATTPSRYRLTPLEIAAGVPLGIDPEAQPLPDGTPLSPRAAFEDVVRSALERPPCVVSFSGGRDSSAVLAVALRLARDEGFETPIAVTLRFQEAPGTVEVRWQEQVVAHLGVEEWVRLDIGEELDYVGPVAQRLLLRHGVVHPPVTPLFWVQLELARGGSLLTGFGGDAVTGGWLPSHSAEALAGRVMPGPRDVPAIGYALAPAPVRRALMRVRFSRRSWLRPKAARAIRAARAGEFGSRPVRWHRFLAWEVRLRRGAVLESTLSRLAEDAGAVIAHPFHDRHFVAALARLGGARGLGDRSSVMRALFSEELPDALLWRTDKANFALAYFRSHTRAFARRWDGRGFDPELVDAEFLRDVWLSLIVDQRSALSLQAAWLDSAVRGREELPAEVV